MRGRKLPRPDQLVPRLEGGAPEKERLKVILQTLARDKRVTEASADLGVSTQFFDTVRRRALQGALDALAPQPLGRPRHTSPPHQEQIDALQREIECLRRDLEACRAREQVALLLAGRKDRGEKKRASAAPAASAAGR
jgi:hypothetical protein